MGWEEDVLRHFAGERRRIVSGWRILLACRRISVARNTSLPTPFRAQQVEDKLVDVGAIVPLEGLSRVYRVDVPYANLIPTSDEQVLQEANPWAVLSHLAALAHHGLTDIIPLNLSSTRYRPSNPARLPLGSTPEDWSDLPRPTEQLPRRIEHVEVIWFRVKGEWDFGETISYSEGLPIYVTDVERTLLDVLRQPEKSGGTIAVFQAWKRAAEHLHLDRLTEYTSRFGEIMRKRVGYVMESLGLSHPRLDHWKKNLGRGGSAKLLATSPYAPTFSEAWNLSLNVPPDILETLQKD